MIVASLLLIIIDPRFTQHRVPTPSARDRIVPLRPSLVSSSFPDQPSCASRQQLPQWRSSSSSNSSNKSPASPYLLSRIRDYEQRHKRCDPHSESFLRNSQELVRLTRSKDLAPDCRYIVWVPVNGLGNRMLSLASSFVYALLTDRVLLVDFDDSMSGLFCEPFPDDATWLLPGDFTFKGRSNGEKFRGVYSLGNLLEKSEKKHDEEIAVQATALLYLYLSGDNNYDMLFYRDDTQKLLTNVPWLVLRSDQHFVPYFFVMPGFRAELDRLFPDKEAVFQHVGRYLFSPTNRVWGRVARFYDTYLAKAEQRIGLQVRVFYPDKTPASLMLPHILRCMQVVSGILPRLQQNETSPTSSATRSRTLKAVLVASLLEEFYTELKDMYWMRPAADDAAVGVYQTSHEGWQETGNGAHNVKALVDIYLLSMCDVLVTSHFSTFGYVAHSLAGLRPWYLQNPGDYEAKRNEPACVRAVSPEPCFHFHPYYDTNSANHGDAAGGGPAPVIMNCEDYEWGFKLANLKY
ncbi:unnamed protein product [Linum tenue]|uniref:Fucosyltransferase n=2 Tax=Linum tenue TaxID=586396 RepID=A0AAV0QV06_9ROSI|nr:unnamed protein product [Linum tenue]